VVSIKERASGKEVLRILKEKLSYDWKEYVVLVASNLDRNPFPILISIILSQNTNDVNSIKAYIELRSKIGVSIDDILNSRLEDLEEAIRVAGLYKQKARAIRELAEKLRKVGGEEFLVRESPERVREFLLSIEGIGPKTADVFLSLYRKAPYFAVDTHARRIAIRWGLVGDKASYSEVSRALLEFFGPEETEIAHRLLIALGRRYCRARSPKCRECPLRDLCPYAQKSSSR